MFLKTVGLFLLTFMSGALHPGLSQSVTATIDRDITVFTTMAALNAAGFDVEHGNQYHPVRQEVRSRLESLDPDLTARLRAFYQEHKGDESDADQVAKYLSLALNLTAPPSLEFAYEEDRTAPDARELAEFVPLLREFYASARIVQMWSTLGRQYESILDSMGPSIRETIVGADAFLRVPLGEFRPRQLVIFLELAAPVNSVNVRNYDDNLYMVLGYSTSVPLEDIRHAYLHLLIDPLVNNNKLGLIDRRALGRLIEGVSGVLPQYVGDFDILLTESLIRSLELKMDRPSPTEAQELVDSSYRSGLLLAPFFFEKLDDFLASDIGIRRFFPEFIDAISVETEQERFSRRFDQIAPPELTATRAEVPPALPVRDPVRELLREAQTAFNEGDDESAQQGFDRILQEYDSSNGSALYGLALVASRAGDADTSREYFARTIQSNSAEPSMLVWAHIFLGRIYDIECERDNAVEQYRQALGRGDDTRDARAAAQAGLDGPFGGGCNP